MTTTVKITAHCASNKQVVVQIDDNVNQESYILQDGENKEVYAYDDRVISVKEELKVSE